MLAAVRNVIANKKENFNGSVWDNWNDLWDNCLGSYSPLARDEKLGRDVALKVLPPIFANDHQRMPAPADS